MPQLLIELFSEEIPARMQREAAHALERGVVGALSDRGLMFEGVRVLSGPRRLALAIEGLPGRQPDTREERKGPRVGAPEKAIEGFLRSAGVRLEDCETRDDGKGPFHVAVIARTGRPTAEVIAEILPAVLDAFPWPKSMRWGMGRAAWVRPLHAIVCVFDGEVVPVRFAGIEAGETTFGHRFLSPGPLRVRRLEDYETALANAHVIADPAERAERIAQGIANQAFARGLEPISDPGLIEEIAGLVEWPVVLIGAIDPAFMDVPEEILITTMRVHQRYVALRDPKTGALAPHFAVVANMAADDGGAAIVAGNERVLRARLSDAKFFWDEDRRIRLEARVAALDQITFHAKLGSLGEKAARVAALAGRLAQAVGADPAQAARAARLVKADLTSGVVGEFPELQGVMGRYYALEDGEDAAIANAIRDHYRPLGPNDSVPAEPVAIAVALADKLDTLTGFWSIGETPTGSKDPFALRRAALGVIRLVLSNGVRLNLSGFGADAGLLAFFADRLKVALREQGVRHDLIDAVFALGAEDDLVRLVAKVEALQSFLGSEDGASLLAGYRRAANILRIEEKKDGRAHDGPPDPALLSAPAEKALFTAMATANDMIAGELAAERFADAMGVMARLRAPVDAFFEAVTVNADDAALRENRLKLLARIRSALHTVADFSKIEG